MTSRSKRLRNCNIIDSTSQNDSQIKEQAREEQSPSSSQPPSESNNTEFENNNQNELFLWIIGGDNSRRKKRGRTTLVDVWNLSERERIEVEVDKYGVPCTYAGSILGSFLGVVAKNGSFAPLNIPRWDNQAFNPFKENMLKLIEAKFRYPEATRHWVLASLNKKWRDYKSELRCEYFSEDKPMQELINNVPLGVMRDQWTSLVARWCTDESKEAARQKFDELSQNSESDESKLIDQAFLSAMGPEHNGRVKGLGMGPTLRTYYGLKQIDSFATTESSGSQSNEVERLKGELERMNEKFNDAVREMREEMPREMDHLRTSLLSNTQGAVGNINPIDAFSPNHHQSSNASHEPTSEGNRRTI